MPNNTESDASKRREKLLLKIDQGYEPIMRITEIGRRESVPNGLRFLLVLSGDHGDDCDVTIGCRKRTLINVRKCQRIGTSNSQFDRCRFRSCRRHKDQEQKISQLTSKRLWAKTRWVQN